MGRYRVPKRIRGLDGRDGPIPGRIFPVFRDRDELPSSADLNDQITAALEASATLIVICSPRAAVSRWVNEEIVTFKRLGRAGRILAFVIDGEPNASDKPGATAADECFPPALRFRLGDDGQLSSQRVEPVAADARPEGDGEENARLKIIAGILGIGFDQLKQRDLEAQRSRLRRLVAIAGTVAIALTGLLVLSVYFAREARAERNRALRHLGDSYAEHARGFVDIGLHDLAARTALMAIRLSEGTSTLAVEVLRYAGALLNLRARFPINIHPGARFALSPDEHLLVSPVGNNVLGWDPETAELRFTFTGHSRAVRSVEFSPDGSRLLAASEDGTARIWDARSGQPLGAVGDGKEEIWFGRFWQNGTAIVTATSRGLLQVWDAATFRERGTLALDESAREFFERPNAPQHGLIGGTAYLAVSPDNRKIALAAQAGATALFVFDRDGRPSTTLLNTSHVDNLVFSPDSQRLVTMAASLVTGVWNAMTGEPLSAGDDQAHGPFAFSADGARSAVAGLSGQVKVTDVSSGGTYDFTNAEFPRVDALQFSRDGRYIAIARNAGPIEVFEILDDPVQSASARFTGHVDIVEALQFSADGRRLYSSSLDGTIRQWSMRKNETPEVLSLPLAAPRMTILAIAGGRLFVSGVDGLRSIELGSMRVTDESASVPQNGGLYVSHRGDRVATEGQHAAWVMKAATREVVQMASPPSMTDESQRIGSLAWSPDDTILAGAAGDAGVVLWNSQTGRLIREIRSTLPGRVDGVAFSRDGSKLVLRDFDGAIQVRRTDGALVFHLGGPDARHAGFAVSPSDDVIVTAGGDGDVQLWDVHTGAAVGRLVGHGRGELGHAVLAVGFSEDGRYILSRSQDSTARIWDAATRSNVMTQYLDASAFYACISLLPGGQQVVVNSMAHGGARIVDVTTGVLAMFLPDASDCPVFTKDRKFAAAPTYRGAIIWDTTRLSMRVEELVAAACDRGELPMTARTFTKFEGDRKALLGNLRLDADGRDVDVCTGRAAVLPRPQPRRD